MIEYSRENMLYMCIRTHKHANVEYSYGEYFRVSEYFFSSYYYYEISDMSGRFLVNMSQRFFNESFSEVDRNLQEIDNLFKSVMDGNISVL